MRPYLPSAPCICFYLGLGLGRLIPTLAYYIAVAVRHGDKWDGIKERLVLPTKRS